MDGSRALQQSPSFARMGWHSPWAGLPGTIFVAFIGAVICLVVLHLIHEVTYRRVA